MFIYLLLYDLIVMIIDNCINKQVNMHFYYCDKRVYKLHYLTKKHIMIVGEHVCCVYISF